MAEHQGLPVPGYPPQSDDNVQKVKLIKETEERLLRMIDELKANPEIDGRWANIAFTHFQEGFMAINRSIFKPTRISLPEDKSNG